MIKINRTYNGYSIKAVESGFGQLSFSADSLDEVCMGIQHYFGNHHIAGTRPDDCPICRKIVLENEREMKQYRHKR
jgi:hypothetical protein